MRQSSCISSLRGRLIIISLLRFLKIDIAAEELVHAGALGELLRLLHELVAEEEMFYREGFLKNLHR